MTSYQTKASEVAGRLRLEPRAPIAAPFWHLFRKISDARLLAGLELCLSLAVLTYASLCSAQAQISPKWEELTAEDFVKGIRQAQGTCLLPFGILEKHGPQLPLGTDLLNVRYGSLKAAAKDYAIVFPEYYFGQIFEARHEPGTVAYSAHLQLELLEETTDEMARNGCKKIIIVNGHGGNIHLLPFFAQAQLASARDYVVYIFRLPPGGERPGRPPVRSSVDQHAGEAESSRMLVARPDLVHLDRAREESGEDLKRLHLPESLYTGIWWYASFPNHYAGDASYANKELGEFDTNYFIDQLVEAIRAVKADNQSLPLQNEFFQHSRHPEETKQ